MISASGEAEVQCHRMRWPRALPHPPILLLGATDMIFGTAGNAAAHLGAGWSAQEDGACWATGARAEITLPLPPCDAPPQAWCLELELAPFTAPPRLPSQRLALAIGDLRIVLPALQGISTVTVTLPPMPGAGWALTLLTPDAARPCDLLGGSDDRALSVSLRRLRLSPVAPLTAPIQHPATADTAVEPDDRTLLLGFESLGENCEFGLVQRRAGAEPLGLLRFASAPLPNLLTALAHRFEGIGTSGRLSLAIGAGGREYMVREEIYGFLSHAGAGPETQAEAILQREARRQPFLANKLIEDLTAGEKIAVFHPNLPLPRETAALLANALAAYGPTPLLWVEPATADLPCGSVLKLSDRLLIGALGRFAPADNAHDVDFQAWLRLCRTCLQALRS